MESITPQPIMRPVDNIKTNKVWVYVVGAFAVVILGVASAWMISAKVMNKTAGAAPGVKVTSTEAGVLDPKVKYDAKRFKFGVKL